MEAAPLQTRRFRLDLAYDGRPYSGWQSQPGGGSVQDAVEEALSAICPAVASVQGSGRTDAGVCAAGQVAHFDAPSHWRMGGQEWRRALNTKLPPTIRVNGCREVDAAFHARFSAVEKTYEYTVVTAETMPPLLHGLAWHQSGMGDLERLAGILSAYEGTHDFRAFSAKRHDGYDEQRNTVRRIAEASLRLGEGFEGIVMRFRGNGFLYKMVRFLVGTAVYVLRGRTPEEEFARLLAGGEGKAPYCAPAAGLSLVGVRYADSPETFLDKRASLGFESE